MTRALLIGLNLDKDEDSMDRSMAELKGLSEACGIEPCINMIQNAREINKATLIGSGKVEEAISAIEFEELDGVIFNDTLTPMQQRNLSKALNVEVLDRTGLILEIFSQRAKTKEAAMQVEFAKLEYILPRLAGMRAELSRQGGTSGSMSSRGLGEKKIELDRRHIEKRMNVLRQNLKDISRERATQRAKRLSSGDFRVSLVGYTNAGKSTIMNALLAASKDVPEDRSVLEKDMLFATLDTTIRRIDTDRTRPFLLSDTVGFIDQLPHTLVSAFRSTLEEVVYADLLLNVVDYSDPDYREHMRVTEQTLSEIGAGAIPVITVFNKADKADNTAQYPRITNQGIYISAKEKDSINELLSMIDRFRKDLEFECDIELPYARMSIYNYLKENAEVLSEKYTENGIFLSVRCRQRDRAMLEEYMQ